MDLSTSLGNLNSIHLNTFIAAIIIIIFCYVDGNRFTEGPLTSLDGTGFVIFVLGVVYLLAIARTKN